MVSEQKSFNGNIWKKKFAETKFAELISQKFGLPISISSIIASRNIPLEAISSFLSPKLSELMPNPSVLKDMDKAAQRIAKAIIAKEKIGIIGDYDVDGATSSSVMKLFLSDLGQDVVVHIPDREEGYGPSRLAFDKFSGLGYDSLVITTDCGTTAFEVFEYAKSKGFDVIVLDHHEAEIKLPDVYALVNPKRLDEDSSADLKYLSAVGVVFMAIVAINRNLRDMGYYKDVPEPSLFKYLDLVALGTVCDVVPLIGLNRAFVSQGLKVISSRSNLGIKTLVDKVGITECLQSYHLGYVLGPRINAGGRVGDSSKGGELLCAENEVTASFIADKLEEFNQSRKEIEGYVLLQAIEKLESEEQEYPMAFVHGNDWHQGVVGIVAGKLKERYNVPSFVMSIEDDEVKGSARSVPGLDLGALIIAAKEKGILTKGGGHPMAAGFSLVESKLEEFKVFAGEYIISHLGNDTVVAAIEFDSYMSLSGLTWGFAEKLDLLQPFGASNPEPKIVIENVKVNYASIFGSGHIKCSLSSMGGGRLSGLCFNSADTNLGHELLHNKGMVYDILGIVRKDTWQGRKSIKFIIEDVRLSNG